MCRSAAEAERAMQEVRAWVAEAGLTLHPTKTRVVHAAQGFDFLGYHFRGLQHWPRKKSLDKLKDTIRTKTPRKNGQALVVIIADVNKTLRGWFGYFRHSLKTTFGRLDKWVRMRLRSILRKRAGRSGRGRGTDHHRWPNRYFADQGLYSLVTAHVKVCQSSLR
jgi:RNA-directed DNA polymerase